MEYFKSSLVMEVQTILDPLGEDYNKQFVGLFEPLINGTPYTLEIRDTITRIWRNAEYCKVGQEFMFSGDIHTKDKTIIFDETIDNLFSILINHYISTRSIYHQLTTARQGK